MATAQQGVMDDDDDDLSTDDPKALKVLRASAKRKTTCAIRRIQHLMRANGRKSAIRECRDELLALRNECYNINERYRAAAPSDQSVDAWYLPIDVEVDARIQDVENHLLARAFEAVSVASQSSRGAYSQIYESDEASVPNQSLNRRRSDPDWKNLRRDVEQLESRGVHGLMDSPALQRGRSPPRPADRPASAPPVCPLTDASDPALQSIAVCQASLHGPAYSQVTLPPVFPPPAIQQDLPHVPDHFEPSPIQQPVFQSAAAQQTPSLMQAQQAAYQPYIFQQSVFKPASQPSPFVRLAFQSPTAMLKATPLVGDHTRTILPFQPSVIQSSSSLSSVGQPSMMPSVVQQTPCVSSVAQSGTLPFQPAILPTASTHGPAYSPSAPTTLSDQRHTVQQVSPAVPAHFQPLAIQQASPHLPGHVTPPGIQQVSPAVPAHFQPLAIQQASPPVPAHFQPLAIQQASPHVPAHVTPPGIQQVSPPVPAHFQPLAIQQVSPHVPAHVTPPAIQQDSLPMPAHSQPPAIQQDSLLMLANSQSPAVQQPVFLSATVQQTSLFMTNQSQPPAIQHASHPRPANSQSVAIQQPVYQSSAIQQPVSQPAAIQQPISRPAAIQQPVFQSAFQQPISPPAAIQQSVSMPVAIQRPVNQSSAIQQPFSQPAAIQQPVSQPAAIQQPISRPAAIQQPVSQSAFQQPVSPPVAIQQPVSRPAAIQQPVYHPSAFQKPASRPAAIQQPVSQSFANQQPVYQPVAIQQPVSQPAAIQQSVSQASAIQQPSFQQYAFQAPVFQPSAIQQPVFLSTAAQLHSLQPQLVWSSNQVNNQTPFGQAEVNQPRKLQSVHWAEDRKGRPHPNFMANENHGETTAAELGDRSGSRQQQFDQPNPFGWGSSSYGFPVDDLTRPQVSRTSFGGGGYDNVDPFSQSAYTSGQQQDIDRQSNTKTPDSWIFERDVVSTSTPSSWLASKLPKIEIEPFNGDPRNWSFFIQSFKNLVHDVVPYDSQRITFLRHCLGENVRKSLADLLRNPAQYRQALTVLRQRYGNPQLVVRAYVTGLLELAPPKDGSQDSLIMFAGAIRAAVADLQYGEHTHDLQAPGLLNQVTKKLPPTLMSKWGEYLFSIQPRAATLMDLDRWLDSRVLVGTWTHECIPSKGKDGKDESKKKSGKKSSSTKQSGGPRVFMTKTPTPCICCSESSHDLPSCPTFKKMEPKQRSELAFEKKCCFRCLKTGHVSRECSIKIRCIHTDCKSFHHPMVHGAPRLSTKSQQKENSDSTPPTGAKKFCGMTAKGSRADIVLLAVVPVVLQANGKRIETFALLDPGSQVSMLKASILEQLGVNPPKKITRFGTYHGQDPEVSIQKAKLTLCSKDGRVSLPLNVSALDTLNLSQRSINWPMAKKRWNHLKDLNLEAIQSDQISVLIGSDSQESQLILDYRRPSDGKEGPWAVLTQFGWSVRGPVSSKQLQVRPQDDPTSFHIRGSSEERTLEELVHRMWSLESFGTHPNLKPLISAGDAKAMAILDRSVKLINGRYESGLLWRDDAPMLPNNFAAAMRRFLLLERRLAKSPALAKAYSKTIQEYIDRGHARELLPEELEGPPGRTWLLPHHAVFHPDKPDKCRVVFDFAAVFMGVVLNLCLLKGPDLMTCLIGVLLRFREGTFVLVGDIEQMFHQVKVLLRDTDVLRFLWRPPGSSEPVKVFKMLVQPFGSVCSPTICTYVLRKAAQDNDAEFPGIYEKTVSNTYVDNFMDSFDSEEEAINIRQSLQDGLQRGGFTYKKWMSNSKRILKTIPSDLRSDSNLDLDFDDLPCEKTLGLWFDFPSDSFIFKVRVDSEANTHRQILSAVAGIYDPIGFWTPVSLPARVILQDITRSKISWDDPLPEIIRQRWEEWVSSLRHLQAIAIPRCIKPIKGPVIAQLHLFADASELGFGAVAYLKITSKEESAVTFVMSKCRVAPLKFVTIPRLELMAALLAARLASTLVAELRVHLDAIIFWSDSSTVLRWIHSTTYKFHTYVANRISEILDLSHPSQWRHVPGRLNPADDCSRGLDAQNLKLDHRWFSGPQFLQKQENEWPDMPTDFEQPEEDPEIKVDLWTGLVEGEKTHQIEDLIARARSWTWLQRVGARLVRFCHNVRLKPENWELGSLSVAEMRRSQLMFVSKAQRDVFHRELKRLASGLPVDSDSHIKKLSPFLDEDSGLLRVGGRLENSCLPTETKHPLLLPAKHPVTRLIVIDIHEWLRHASVERTLVEIRRQFWIPAGRQTVKSIIFGCQGCKRYRQQPAIPIMASLPSHRLQFDLPAFSNVGVDYFGPILTTVGRRKEKRWGVIFTCLVTRGVHFEMAHFLDTSSFLMAFWRFARRRGHPRVVYSDNGTNLTAGEKEIREGLQRFNQQKITAELVNRHIQWIFSPPSAPHFGGVWERLIKSAKISLQFILHDRSVSDEVLNSALVEVESIMNDRPLTHLSVDPNDPIPVTPNHLMLGRANPSLPFDESEDFHQGTRKRWKNVQAIADHFWRRWLREYVPNLTERRTWLKQRRNLAVGDVVLIIDPSTPRGLWPLGRVVEIFPGPDGVVRSAKVINKHGEYHRPIAKLCLLEVSSSENVSVLEENRAGDVPDLAIGKNSDTSNEGATIGGGEQTK